MYYTLIMSAFILILVKFSFNEINVNCSGYLQR